ncbi:coenzyme PQQ biosynthesis protein PqqF [Pseudomonas sp. 1D4]|uniref:pyrroloquinoline quinone biosynthesis protein PqqF n=1 Tax=Pseudomonas sp. 1D4 TaxID=1843691 RepID=UPI00084B32D2|nr:pyrroloquinoline quinone biosynthesis protein PqqF [Pseudomonas sp. 1D4]OEC45018.1 coenzyme PQQ biosynthesis protein PqqF [Pseudomonas sp. 1D4]
MSETPAPSSPLPLRTWQQPGTLAAVLLRVHAGSHDAPREWPGLAHFLEHLRFLGGQRFTQSQRLMPFVQASGGRLNASTQAHHTDYFFELPADRLQAGLERLADLIQAPLPGLDLQRREREILQIEYLNRGRDPWTQAQSALAATLAPGHPLADFHAGHRDSLAIDDPAFQAALAHFAGAGERQLWVAAPQPAEQVQALVQQAFAGCPPGQAQPHRAPPPLLPLTCRSLRLQLPGAPRQWLAFALERQPEALPDAVALLGELLRDESPGSFQGWLCEQGLCDGLDLHLTYHHQGQALLVLELALADASADTRARIEGGLFGWLASLREREPWARLLHERPAAPRQAPLEFIRDQAQRHGTLPASALAALLAQLQPARLVRLLSEARPVSARCLAAGFELALEPAPLRPEVRWHFGPALAFQAFVATQQTSRTAPPLMRWPGDPEHAQLLLRWRLTPSTRDPAHHPALQRALRGLRSQAQQQGGDLLLLEQGLDWQLRVIGRSRDLPAMLAAALRTVLAPPLAACEQGPRLLQAGRNRQAAELPIRQLLHCLPDVLGTARGAAPGQAGVSPASIRRSLDASRWDVIALGLADDDLPSVQALLDALPGEAMPRSLAPPALAPGHHWHHLPSEGEPALVLFCPVPDRSARSEALWHWLGRTLESPFYQRLRTELNLGYAVFAGLRHMGGQAGLVFAVQAADTPVPEVLAQVQAFLNQAPPLLAQAEPLREGLQQAWRQAAADLPGNVSTLHLAARPADWHLQLALALATLAPADLHRALARLVAGEGGWHLLANAPSPGLPWR